MLLKIGCVGDTSSGVPKTISCSYSIPIETSATDDAHVFHSSS